MTSLVSIELQAQANENCQRKNEKQMEEIYLIVSEMIYYEVHIPKVCPENRYEIEIDLRSVKNLIWRIVWKILERSEKFYVRQFLPSEESSQ